MGLMDSGTDFIQIQLALLVKLSKHLVIPHFSDAHNKFPKIRSIDNTIIVSP